MVRSLQPPHDALARAFDHYLDDARRNKSVRLSLESARGPQRYARDFAEGRVTDVAPLYQVQQVLRPMFGKGGNRPPDIGDHPDFKHLKGTDGTAFCPITTMFVDIEGSTRLGILFSPEEVFRIKNAFIRAAIEVVTSFDGHVHRIMGDAVMAYFGGCNVRPESGAIDALNCAATLRAMVERVVVPRLNEIRPDHQFGVRIGLDYGAKDSVLWSSYGYPMSEEVTATSFFVDVASKLQHAAGRNRIMVGESLRQFLDLPDEFLSVKRVIQQGHWIDEPFVSPNHTDADGAAIDYRQHVFDGDRFLSVGPVGQRYPKLIGADGGALHVAAEVFTTKGGQFEGTYAPCTGPIAKSKWIRFTPRLPYMPRLPYTIKCTVENHGKEALEQAGADRGNHSQEFTITTKAQHESFRHWEYTAYRGLQYMNVDVKCHGARYSTRVGVFIE